MNQPQPAPKFPPHLVLFIGILAVSTAAIFIRLAQAEAPSLVVAALRLTFAAVLLTPWVLITRRAELRSLRARDGAILVLSGFFLALHFASWITSLEYTSVASSVVLVTTTPLWVAIASPILLREKPEPSLFIGLVLALFGSILAGMAENCGWVPGTGLTCDFGGSLLQGGSLIGNGLALLGAMLAAAYLMIGRRMRSRIDMGVYIWVVYGSAAVFLLLGVLAWGLPLGGYAPRFYVFALLLALIPQIIGHSTYNWALAYLPATFVSISLLGEPIGTILLAYFILREKPTLLEVVGGVLILCGIYMASRSRKKAVKTGVSNSCG